MPFKVLLLESGEEEPLVTEVSGLLNLFPKSSIDYNYTTQAEPKACGSESDRTCKWVRGKVMGGSSAINAMQFVRGCKIDYDNWSNLGNTGWSWDDVLPYFKKSENIKIAEVRYRFLFS